MFSIMRCNTRIASSDTKINLVHEALTDDIRLEKFMQLEKRKESSDVAIKNVNDKWGDKTMSGCSSRARLSPERESFPARDKS